MNEPSSVNRPGEGVSTLDDIATELFPQNINEDLSNKMQFQEERTWNMRWVVLGVIAGGITVLNAVISVILFFITKSPIVFVPTGIVTGGTPLIFLKDIIRYLFWGTEDYRLEELKITLKAKKWEMKYLHKSLRGGK